MDLTSLSDFMVFSNPCNFTLFLKNILVIWGISLVLLQVRKCVILKSFSTTTIMLSNFLGVLGNPNTNPKERLKTIVYRQCNILSSLMFGCFGLLVNVADKCKSLSMKVQSNSLLIKLIILVFQCVQLSLLNALKS